MEGMSTKRKPFAAQWSPLTHLGGAQQLAHRPAPGLPSRIARRSR